PGLDGLDVLYRLAEMGTTAEVIVTSGHGLRVAEAAQRVAKELNLSSPGVLTKPFTPQQLRSLLQSPHDEAAPAIRPRRETKKVARHEIVSAGEEREFGAYFQPKIGCNTGAATGLEALARWRHPQRGMLTREHCVPHAEES